MRIQSGLQTPLNIFVESVGGQGNDRDGFRVTAVQRTDAAGRFQTIHIRHAHIHEDRIIIAFRRCGEFLQGNPTVFCQIDLYFFCSQNHGHDLCIDLHRDAYAASYGGSNTVSVGGTDVAKLMLLIGKGEGVTGQGYDVKPDWQANLAIAQAITDDLNQQADGLCREVCLKPGRFNQHAAPACILVEAGNNRNTLEQVLAAMPYLADAIDRTLGQGE